MWVCHLTLSLTLLSSLRYFQSMRNAGTTFTAKKPLKRCPAMATKSLKMETQAGRLHSDHTQTQLTSGKFWRVRKANVQNLWGPGELMKFLSQNSTWRRCRATSATSNDTPSPKMLKMSGIPHQNSQARISPVGYHNAFAVSANITDKNHRWQMVSKEVSHLSHSSLGTVTKLILFTWGIRYNPQK